MGLRNKLKRAADIGTAPIRGAVKGAQDVGVLPTAKTVRGALKGDKSDIAQVGLTAAAIGLPAVAGARRLATATRAAGTLPEVRGLARGAAEVAPHIRSAARAQRAGASASAGLSMGARNTYVRGRASTTPALGDLVSTAMGSRQPRSASVSRWIAGERGSLDTDKVIQFPRKTGDAVRRMKARVMGSVSDKGPSYESASRTMRGALKELGAGDAVGPGKPRTMTGYMSDRFGEGATSRAIAKAENVGRRLEGIARARSPKVVPGERGSLDLDKYMDMVRTRFKSGGLAQISPKAGSGLKPKTAVQLMDEASRNVPEGMVMGVAGRRGVNVGKGSVTHRGSVTNLMSKPAKPMTEKAGEQAANTVRRAWTMKRRMEGSGGGTLRGFYEKIKSEEGSLKLDKYMAMVEARFKNAPVGGGMGIAAKPTGKAQGVWDILEKASRATPRGQLFGASGTLSPIAGTKRAVTTNVTAMAADDAFTPVSELLRRTDQADKSTRRVRIMDKRLGRLSGGSLRGFYEKIKDETGWIKIGGDRKTEGLGVKHLNVSFGPGGARARRRFKSDPTSVPYNMSVMALKSSNEVGRRLALVGNTITPPTPSAYVGDLTGPRTSGMSDTMKGMSVVKMAPTIARKLRQHGLTDLTFHAMQPAKGRERLFARAIKAGKASLKF